MEDTTPDAYELVCRYDWVDAESLGSDAPFLRLLRHRVDHARVFYVTPSELCRLERIFGQTESTRTTSLLRVPVPDAAEPLAARLQS
jgi:hypothetical protein